MVAIVKSRDKGWTVPEMMEEAARGGLNISDNEKVYNAFYIAARRLADKKGLLRRDKKKGVNIYKWKGQPIGVEQPIGN